MKLDLVEINRLSPPGLWDLGILSALISTLLSVIEAGIGGGRSVLYYTRMVVQRSDELREKTRANLNMRIKAWVMQCPERIAWVRGIIGEASIRRWRKNRLADYALTKYFGDWRKKFPNGFENRDKKLTRKPARRQKLRAYNWKPFALAKIFNVEQFLYGQTRANPDMDEIQEAYYKLWGVNILDTDYLYKGAAKSTQPRGKRSFKPVAFTPYELAVETVPHTPENKEGILEEAGETVRLPHPKSIRKAQLPSPDDPVSTASRAPPYRT